MPHRITPPSVAVYLGSAGKARVIFKDACRDLGQKMAADQFYLVYGGMNAGLMGIVAQSALDAGGHVTGVIPRRLKDSERAMAGLTQTVWTGTLSERKFDMFCRADAFIIMPGGFGTLDEALEILYWRALGHHQKPLYFVNIDGYWDDVIEMLRSFPAIEDDFFAVMPSTDSVIEALNTHFKSQDAPPYVDIEYPDPLPHFEDEVASGQLDHILVETPSLADLTRALTALGLKQLGKHQTPIGFLNSDGQFDGFMKWIYRAQEEHFITPKCSKLFCAAPDKKQLMDKLKHSEHQDIDLHAEKWGE